MRLRLSNGLSLGYRSAGSGRVIVLLHPVGTRAEFWDDLTEHLGSHYRCLSIDFRGCGESDTPTARFSLDDLADDVIELLRVQGIRESVIVGCSMGGMVAQGAALKAPELFAGIVLTGTIHTQTPERRKIPLQRAQDCLPGMPPVIEETLARWFAPDFLAANGPRVREVRRWLLALDPVVFSWSWEAIAGLNYGDRLRDISMPALLIRGSHDVAGRTMPEMAALMRRARFIEVPDVGHMGPMEEPGVFAELITEFIGAEIGNADLRRLHAMS